MLNNICPVCAGKREVYFNKTVLWQYKVNYFYCIQCGLLQTEQPYWLDEAYSTPISDADTGLVARNLLISRKLACMLYFLFGKQGKYLDKAGGYGLLTRLMRDIGFDFYWSDKYCENLLARGFESTNTLGPFVAITAFEVLEHIHDPLASIRESLSEFGTKTIIFSTQLYEGLPPRPDEWWYYGFNTGQHISFYQKKTLRYIADNLGLYFHTNSGIHMLTDKNINLLIFKIITGRFLNVFYRNVFYRIVCRNMQSKTFSDHKKILESGTF